MKITKRENDRWYDENNNSWDSVELATFYSPTLTTCSYCSGCSYCSNCSSCRDCSYCNLCNDCTRCTNCDYCDNCSHCGYCSDCSDCLGLYNYRDKENLEPQVRILPPTSRIELDINDRKLEPDL